MDGAPRFSGIRSTPVHVGAPGQPLLVDCRKGGAQPLEDCPGCPCFVAVQVTGAASRVQCRVSADDPVRELMTPAAALALVDPLATVEEAREVARAANADHLLVLAGERLVGVLSADDLAAAHAVDDLVVSRMSGAIVDVSPAATLGEALATMDRYQVDCLPVRSSAGFLLGALTRADLYRAGAPAR